MAFDDERQAPVADPETAERNDAAQRLRVGLKQVPEKYRVYLLLK
jgi:DNA-directed RNA polymerase specialized sigma24 family protein